MERPGAELPPGDAHHLVSTVTAAHPRRQAAIAFIVVTAVLDVMALGIVIPVLPKLIEGFTGSNAQAGFVNGVFVAIWAVMQFLCSPVIGAISDRYGRRPVVLISSAGLALDYVLIALAPNLWWLALARIVGGITTASFSTATAYLADITPPEGRAKAFGLIGAAWSGGFVLGPLLGGLLGEADPRTPFWVAAGIQAVVFAYGVFVLPESLAPEKRMAFSWARANPLGSLRLLRSHPELQGLAGVNFLLWFSHHVFTAVFVLYAGQRFGWGTMEVGFMLALVGVLDIIVQAFITGPAVKRHGDRNVMVVGLIGGAVGLAVMGLATTPVWFVASLLPNAMWGLAMPTLQSLMTRRVSESEQGQLQGANSSVQSIAGILSPLFFGWIYSQTSGDRPWVDLPGTAFVIAGLVLALSALLGWRVCLRESAATPAAAE